MLNSPSLMADALEYRTHMLSSGIVFLALIGHEAGIPLDRYAALAIVVFIAKTGWELLSGGMRVLLDASLDADTLENVRAIITAEPAVTTVRSLVGRNAGRYRFLEAEVPNKMNIPLTVSASTIFCKTIFSGVLSDADGIGHFCRRVGHQHHIGGFDGGV